MASIFVTIAITSGDSMRCTVRRSSVTRIRSPASNAKSQSWRWQMMINCTSRRGAVHEILDAVNADFAPAFTFDEAMRLLRALEHRHAPVARSFYSVVGRRLQFIDSQLLMRVLDRCLKDGIVGLPIHDSIIAKAGRDADRVSEIMVIVSKGNLQTAAPSAGRRWPNRPSSGSGNDPAICKIFNMLRVLPGGVCQVAGRRLPSLPGQCPAARVGPPAPACGEPLDHSAHRSHMQSVRDLSVRSARPARPSASQTL